ncbi:hypothetical protein U1Q18_025585, partial [Sarracenia purpurea var. burkii]
TSSPSMAPNNGVFTTFTTVHRHHHGTITTIRLHFAGKPSIAKRAFETLPPMPPFPRLRCHRRQAPPRRELGLWSPSTVAIRRFVGLTQDIRPVNFSTNHRQIVLVDRDGT